MSQRRLAASALAAGFLAVASPAAAATTLDHWTCARAIVREPRGNFRVTLGSPVGPQSCVVKRPAKLACVATTGTSITPEIPGLSEGPGSTSFLCYQLKCRRRVGIQQQLQDAFGQHTVGFGIPRWLCSPAVGPSTGPTTTTIPGATTTTVAGGSTTTTTTLQDDRCRFENGQCRGTCSGGGSCRAAVGTGSCECRNVPCGDADTPQCNGACPSADQACVFTITGCSCIGIP